MEHPQRPNPGTGPEHPNFLEPLFTAITFDLRLQNRVTKVARSQVLNTQSLASYVDSGDGGKSYQVL